MFIKYLGENKYKLAVRGKRCEVVMRENSWYHIDIIDNNIYFEGDKQKLKDIAKEKE